MVSKTALHWRSHSTYLEHWTHSWNAKRDVDEVVLIRMTMMNPFFSSREMTTHFSDEYIKELSEILKQS
jgi:hypothetical protein